MIERHRVFDRQGLTGKESIKENTLVFAWFVLGLSILARAVEWRFSVSKRMKKREGESFGRPSGALSKKGQSSTAPDDFAAVAAAFAKFQKRYCDSEPHTPEELRVIEAPLGFGPT